MQQNLQTIWQDIIEGASPNLPDNTVELWLRSCEPVSVEDDELVLDVANVFIREQVAAKFLSELNRAAKACGHVKAVRLDVKPELDEGAEKQTEWAERAEKTVRKNTRLGLNPNYEFSSFVVGKSNRLAHAASLAVAETPGGAFNPLFIWGGTGLGKTHLMHAICHYALDKNSSLNIVYVSSEKFVNEFIDSIHATGGAQSKAFKNRYRNVDMLLIDDIQFLAGKDGSQEEFFNTFNDLYNDKRQIIICSDRSPADLDTIIMKRLTSRMSFGMVTDIQPPDLETRIAILRKKASLRKSAVPDEIVQFLAQRIPRNIRELEGALNRVIASAELSGEPITTDNTEIWLKDVLSNDVRTTTVSSIQAAVAESFSISIDDLTSSKRTNDVAFARHVAMYLCREILSELSLHEIAMAFKKKDHTTVIHAQRRIEKLLKDKDSDAVRIVSEAKGRL